MTQPDPTTPASAPVAAVPPATPRPIRNFVLSVLVLGLLLGVNAFSCVPVAQRLASPVVCARDVVESVVVSHVTRNDRGSIVTVYELHCIDADGGSSMPMGAAVFGTLFGYGVVIALVLLAAMKLRARFGSASVAAVAALVLGGCDVGTLSRSQYEARYPYGAGPMLSQGRSVAAARVLAQRLGGRLLVTEASFSPETVLVFVVADAARKDIDRYMIEEEGIVDSTPMRHSSFHSIAEEGFELAPEMLAPLPQIVREATARVGFPEGHVEYVTLRRNFNTGGTGAVEFEADVVSRRHHGRVRFDATGRMIEATFD